MKTVYAHDKEDQFGCSVGVKKDSLPFDLDFVLVNESGPVDLTGADIDIVLKEGETEVLDSEIGVITDAEAGQFKWVVPLGAMDTIGDFCIEMTITVGEDVYNIPTNKTMYCLKVS